jgi:hypothetical protein
MYIISPLSVRLIFRCAAIGAFFIFGKFHISVLIWLRNAIFSLLLQSNWNSNLNRHWMFASISCPQAESVNIVLWRPAYGRTIVWIVHAIAFLAPGARDRSTCPVWGGLCCHSSSNRHPRSLIDPLHPHSSSSQLKGCHRFVRPFVLINWEVHFFALLCTSSQCGCVFTNLVQICCLFFFFYRYFPIVCSVVRANVSVSLTNNIFAVAVLAVSFTRATIRRNIRPCKKIGHFQRQKGIYVVQV